ncbi:hypothetical protein AAVH_03591 [Aphelenchoides avenae]|nr:hypothetical protein AAVH_03591 [Aphelenchus avenae]
MSVAAKQRKWPGPGSAEISLKRNIAMGDAYPKSPQLTLAICVCGAPAAARFFRSAAIPALLRHGAATHSFSHRVEQFHHLNGGGGPPIDRGGRPKVV